MHASLSIPRRSSRLQMNKRMRLTEQGASDFSMGPDHMFGGPDSLDAPGWGTLYWWPLLFVLSNSVWGAGPMSLI